MSKETHSFWSKEKVAAGVAIGVGVVAAGLALRRLRRRVREPKRLDLIWDQRQPFRDDAIEGVRYHGDPDASDKSEMQRRVAVVGAPRDAYDRQVADLGGSAAIAYTDPEGRWHVGGVPEGERFGLYGPDHNEYRAVAMHLGSEAVQFALGVETEGVFTPAAETVQLTETTVDVLAKEPTLSRVKLS